MKKEIDMTKPPPGYRIECADPMLDGSSRWMWVYVSTGTSGAWESEERNAIRFAWFDYEQRTKEKIFFET